MCYSIGVSPVDPKVKKDKTMIFYGATPSRAEPGESVESAKSALRLLPSGFA